MSRDARRRILIVDDEGPVRTLLSEFLSLRGFESAESASADEALAMLSRERFDLVLSDIQMPGRNGMSLLADIRTKHPDTAVLMITGCEDLSTAVDAMKTGAVDYVTKPFVLSRVEQAVDDALARTAALREQSDRIGRLEEAVERQTGEVRQLLGRLNEASENTLEALVAALDAREHETKAHSRRVAEYTVTLARALAIDGEAIEDIRRGAMLHDVGKIGISDNILLKPGRLNDDEWRDMRRHPEIGYWIVNGIDGLRGASQIVLSHHERYDGGGYPARLQGDEIPLAARIFSVADSLDAITSDRPYRRGLSFEAAREEIARHSGAQFDPKVVNAFLGIPSNVWMEIRERTLSGREPATSAPPQLVAQCRLHSF